MFPSATNIQKLSLSRLCNRTSRTKITKSHVLTLLDMVQSFIFSDYIYITEANSKARELLPYQREQVEKSVLIRRDNRDSPTQNAKSINSIGSEFPPEQQRK